MISIPRQSEPSIHAETEFVFREVRTAQELRDVLALRYRVYSSTKGYAHLTSLDPASGLDADAYDLVSRHFALFARTGRREIVAGTLRITSTETSPQVDLIRAVAVAHPSLLKHFGAERTAPLPMLSYLEQAAVVAEQYRGLAERGTRIAEPGRLTVAPELRLAAGRRGVRLSYFIVECTLAFSRHVDHLDQVFVDCVVALEPFYQRFGFIPTPCAGATFQPGLGISLGVLQATPESIPAALRNRVRDLARQWIETGEAVMSLEPTVAAMDQVRPALLPASFAA